MRCSSARRRSSARRCIVAGEDFIAREEHGRLVFEDARGLLDLPLPRLAGRHQHQNAADAIAALRVVEPDLPASRVRGRAVTAPNGRRGCKACAKGRVVGARAAQAPKSGSTAAITRMAGACSPRRWPISRIRRRGRWRSICGTLATKDTAAFLRAFKGLAQEVLAVPVNGEHAGRSPREVAAIANADGIPAAACDSVESALRFLAARDWPCRRAS